MHTPEFVAWTIPLDCPLRELSDWRSPVQTERLLRPLRACSEAIAEGRVSEGVARQDSASGQGGFRVTDVLAPYGELISIDRLCAGCPANASLRGPRPGWAGCYGEFARDEGGGDLARSMEPMWRDLAGPQLFPATEPAWYGLWMRSEPTREQLLGLEAVFSHLASTECVRGVRDFLAAVRTSLDNDLSLIVELSPAGELVADGWIIAAHCPRCRAERPEMRSCRCQACGDVNHPLPARKRKRRGMRPYRPLSEF
jgi:hypothetical protein